MSALFWLFIIAVFIYAVSPILSIIFIVFIIGIFIYTIVNTVSKTQPKKGSEYTEKKKNETYEEKVENKKEENILEHEGLTSVEKSFLKYLDGCGTDKLCVANYWYYEYGMDFDKETKRFCDLGLLHIKNEMKLEWCKIPKLKEILTLKSLTKVGKKADLILRIEENFSQDELKAQLKSNPRFHLTDKGNKLVDGILPSATHNLDLEDKCIDLILQGDYNNAYKRVCDFRLSAPGPIDIDSYWERTRERGWHGRTVNGDNEIDRLYSACSIFCDMAGLSSTKAEKLAKRLGVEITKQDYVNDHYIKAVECSKMDLQSYIISGIEKYSIWGSRDATTCEKCSMLDGKVFKVSEAKIGVNMPPFCEKCRCTIVAYFDN